MPNLINTLRQVEKLLAWSHTGRRPMSDSVEVGMVHEGLLHCYGERGPDGAVLRSGETSERGLYRLITGAVKTLAEMGIHGIDLTSVAAIVDTWKNTYFVKALQHFDSIEEMREEIGYCWACFSYGDVDAAHVITRGARPDLIEEADNQMLLCRDCHTYQHKKGWGALMERHPHIYPRYEYVIEKFGIANE